MDFYRSLQNSEPMIMGILNVSPDSFSDGGLYLEAEKAMVHARQMARDGAKIIDVGGESTRPGAKEVSAEEEWRRIGPVLQQLCPWAQKQEIWLSVDTYKPEIARRSLELGVDIINDVSGGCKQMYDLVNEFDASYVLMHNPFHGRPHARKESIKYRSVLEELTKELTEKSSLCPKVILDPGLGFGKSAEDNWKILARLSEFPAPHPVLIGASNKRFVRELAAGENFLGVNLAICAAALLGGAKIIRSHEVEQHYRCALAIEQLMRHG